MISIIIPTLNEAGTIEETIRHTLAVAKNPDDLELIVIDAGSGDETLQEVKKLKVMAYSEPQFVLKKYASLNFGAQKARGDILLFLDADTWLPRNYDRLIRKKLQNEKVVGGAFELSFRNPDWKLMLLTLINRIRYRVRNTYYGDQAIWVRRSSFEKAGGYPNQPLMEAAYLCRKLKKMGKLCLVSAPVQTSARRFNTYGFFRVFWFDVCMFARFSVGLPVATFAHDYWHKNRISHD